MVIIGTGEIVVSKKVSLDRMFYLFIQRNKMIAD